MAFGTAPFGTREFDDMIAQRIEGRKRLKEILQGVNASAPPTVLRADPLAPGPIDMGPEPAPAAPAAPTAPAEPSGRVGLDAAIRAGGRERNFFGGLVQGFGAAGEANRTARDAASSQALERADKERQFGLDERRVAAEELRAGRMPVGRTPSETTAEELAATLEFLQKVRATPDEIKTYFLTKGRSSSGDMSDLDNLARSYVETGRAKTMAEGYILARRESANPQPVGFIRKTIYDPKSLNFTVVNASVYRRYNPLTGTYETLDQWGNQLTAEDQAQIQGNPNAFAGGTGGAAMPFGGAPDQPGTGAAPPSPILERLLNPAAGFNLPPEALPPTLRPGPVPLGGRQPAAAGGASWLRYVKPGG